MDQAFDSAATFDTLLLTYEGVPTFSSLEGEGMDRPLSEATTSAAPVGEAAASEPQEA